MVATISRLHGGNATYYTKSYYLDGQADGEWLETRATSALGLAGQPVKPREFERLLRGFDPHTVEPLVQNAGDEFRHLGCDSQYGVSKEISVLYALLPETREAFDDCLTTAAKSALLEVLEPQFLQTRRGSGGKVREPVSSPIALFIHRTNRENEIHLHCHAPIPNVGLREDGTWGAIVSWNLYDAKLALGRAFNARFAEEVTRRLGIECQLDENGLARVKAFPRHVAEALSTPSRRIAEAAEDQSAKAREEANLKTRATKHELPLDIVAEQCRERAGKLGFSAEDARAFLGRVTPENRPEAAEEARALLREIVKEMPQEFSKAQLFERAFREGAKAGLPFAAVREATQETLADGAQLQHLGRVERREQYRRLDPPELTAETTETQETHERVERKEPSRRLDPAEMAAGAPELEETHEKGLREYLKRIIAATPELEVTEFLPDRPAREAVHAHSSLDETVRDSRQVAAALEGARDSGITPEDIRATLEPLGLAPHLNERAVEVLVEAARARMQGDSARRTSPLATASLDTSSPEVGAETRARDEAERLERRWVEAAKEIPEARARSLLGAVIDHAREEYAERLVDSAVTTALNSITEREAHFTRDRLADAVQEALSGKPVPTAQREAAIDQVLKDPGRAVALGAVSGEERYTTPEILRAEREAIRAAEALQERSRHAERAHEVREKLHGLPVGERNAVAKALSGSDLVFVEGRDGAQMKAVQRGIREALRENAVQRGIDWALGRKDLLWVAPTATAARELEKNVGAEHVATLQKLLHNLDRGLGETLRHHGSMVVNAALGRPTWDAQQLALTSRTTVILDSASLADTRQVSRLLQHAERAGARVIGCVTHEMPSLGPGGLVRELRERSDAAHVVTLPDAEKKPVVVQPTRGPEEAKKALIEQWATEAMKRPREHTIVAASSRDVHELNEMAQAKRKEAGLLGFRWMEVRYRLDGQLVKERIYEGDRVVFTARNDKDVVNGVFGTVKHIDLITGRVKIQLDLKEKRYLPWEFERHKTIKFGYRKYRFFQRQEEGFRLGYAATVYRSQNVQVEGNSYCLLGGPDGAASAVYAGLGLARGSTYFFGDQPERRAELLAEKQSAHSVMRQAEQELLARKVEQQVRPPTQQLELGRGYSMGF